MYFIWLYGENGQEFIVNAVHIESFDTDMHDPHYTSVHMVSGEQLKVQNTVKELAKLLPSAEA